MISKLSKTLFCLLVSLGVAGVGCDDGIGDKRPPPGDLQAGVARVRMPVPVGIGTVGYGGFGVSAEPSPFAEIYPATIRVHGHPEFKVVAISRGEQHEVIFLRADTVGVFQQFRRAVVLEAEARLGRPIDDALIMAGTHTHSGPGRVINGGGVYDIIADKFFPEFYENMIDQAATAIVNAVDDYAPAQVGHVWATAPEGHSDRRCEDGMDYTNPSLPVVAVQRNGQIDGLVFAYAIHGTVLDIEDLTLSKDVSGAIEQYIEEGFDHPVVAMFFNSWGADMAPGNPNVPLGVGAALPPGYERMYKVARNVSDEVHAALPQIIWETEPNIVSEVHRVHLNRQSIGYEETEFPFEWGGVYCGGGGDTDCDPATNDPFLDQLCVPFPENYPAPPQTELSAGRVGEIAFITFPGEPGTLLAEELLRRLDENVGFSNVMFLGYTQDYTGYSILEDDWFQGGYEAGGSIWGPRQGLYLLGKCEEIFDRVLRGPGRPDLPDAPPPLEPFDVPQYDPYLATPGENTGLIVLDAAPTYAPDEVVEVTVQGGDPWLGAPIAALVDDGGTPVRGTNTKVVDSDGYAFWSELVPVPSYSDEPDAATRAFQWTFSMPIQQTVGGLIPDLTSGTYQIRITVPTLSGDLEVFSLPFTVQ